MSNGTDALLLELWEGMIPAVIHLYPSDVTSMEQPKPLYVMLPRMGYLGNVSEEVIEHFKEFVPHCQTTEIWFEVECEPLNWQLPAGVLYDQFIKLESTVEQSVGNKLPWRLTVHFQSFPFSKLVRAEGDKALESHYFHSLKQGLFLEHGGSGKAMAIEADDQRRLWTSLLAVDKVMFASVDRLLRRELDPHSIPVRIIVKGNSMVIQSSCRPPYSTIGELLDTVIKTEGGEVIVCHGVEVDKKAPLVEVWASLHHPDHFLYITVLP